MGWIFSLFVGFHLLFAGPYFTPLRDDQSLPKKCDEMELSFFNLAPEYFYMGRKGALSMGYTFEYPVTRSNANTLWKYFRSYVSGKEDLNLKNKIMANKDLKRDYEIIMRDHEELDFDFAAEGEILEILAIEKLYEEFPENHYYITGSVEYHESYSPMTIGEIDIFVGNRKSCEAVAVGEVKLGTKKMLKKAKKQLDRLDGFLVDHKAAGLGSEYKPNSSKKKVPWKLPSADHFEE